MPAGWAAAIAAIVGAGMQANSARNAESAQDDATRKALAAGTREYNQSRADIAPWRDAGASAVGDLETFLGKERTGASVYGDDPRYKKIYQAEYDRVDAAHRKQYGGRGLESAQQIDPTNWISTERGIAQRAAQQFEQTYPDAARSNRSDPMFGAGNRKFTMADFWADPVTASGFQSGLELGAKSINNAAGASGMRRSGQTLQALTKFGTDYTGQKAGDSYNRYYADQDRIFNRLSGVAGTGQTATVNTAALGAQNTQNISSLLTGAANARGAAGIASANAWSGALNNTASNYQQNQMLDRYLANRNGGSGSASNFYYTGNTAAGGDQYG